MGPGGLVLRSDFLDVIFSDESFSFFVLVFFKGFVGFVSFFFSSLTCLHLGAILRVVNRGFLGHQLLVLLRLGFFRIFLKKLPSFVIKFCFGLFQRGKVVVFLRFLIIFNQLVFDFCLKSSSISSVEKRKPESRKLIFFV